MLLFNFRSYSLTWTQRFLRICCSLPVAAMLVLLQGQLVALFKRYQLQPLLQVQNIGNIPDKSSWGVFIYSYSSAAIFPRETTFKTPTFTEVCTVHCTFHRQKKVGQVSYGNKKNTCIMRVTICQMLLKPQSNYITISFSFWTALGLSYQ